MPFRSGISVEKNRAAKKRIENQSLLEEKEMKTPSNRVVKPSVRAIQSMHMQANGKEKKVKQLFA